MRWKRIPKENTTQPDGGNYREWKELLAEEGFHQCVYCAIHEACFGGIRNFHVEHYRPKSKFMELETDIKNLFYACAICNVFKSNDWPEDPCEDFSNPSYPDPSQVDYNDLFSVNDSMGVVEGKYIASKYIVEKLYLNRPQLIVERRIAHVFRQLDGYCAFFRRKLSILTKINRVESKKFVERLATLVLNICTLQGELLKLRPYEEADIRRDEHAKQA